MLGNFLLRWVGVILHSRHFISLGVFSLQEPSCRNGSMVFFSLLMGLAFRGLLARAADTLAEIPNKIKIQYSGYKLDRHSHHHHHNIPGLRIKNKHNHIYGSLTSHSFPKVLIFATLCNALTSNNNIYFCKKEKMQNLS